MKMKIFSLLAATAMVLCIAAGCASSDSPFDASKGNYTEGQPPAYDGIADEDNADRKDSFAPDVNPGNPEGSGKKMIYTAYISIEVSNVTDAMDVITSAASELGGFVSGSEYRNDSRVSGSITVRIPPDKLGELSNQIDGLGKILSNNLSSQDVTLQYVDLDSRLKNAEAQEKQLLTILEKASEITDILAVRTELGIIQQEIEVYKGQLRYLDNMVDFSTVTVSLTEIYIPESPEADADKGLLARWGMDYIGANIAKGFKNSLTFIVNAFGFILILLSYLLVPLLIVGTIIFVIVFIAKKMNKRSGKAGNKSAPSGSSPTPGGTTSPTPGGSTAPANSASAPRNPPVTPKDNGK